MVSAFEEYYGFPLPLKYGLKKKKIFKIQVARWK
jgi:hypothetical protein